jgi:nicotinamide-nucleotide adenylyltransferase
MSDTKRAFYVGRFQPYHLGHHHLITQILKEIDELVIGIGSSQYSHDRRNPFTAGERITMITSSLWEYENPIYPIPIFDVNRHSIWVSHVCSMTPKFSIVYSNNPLISMLFREAGFEVKQLPMFHREEYSGSEIRRRMIEGEDWQSLVTSQVIDVIGEINGVERVREVNLSDTAI